MKLYILRHEDRTIDATFFAPLTEKGMSNSVKLIPILNDLNITQIYSSPFIRTLQTIYPFSKTQKKKINIEYNLMEILHQDIIPPKSYNVRLPTYIAKQFNSNENYNSQQININYPEDDYHLEIRVKNFLKYIINKYHNTEENILLVTHQGLCKIILNIVNKFSNIKAPIELLNNYPTGSISLVFQNDSWTYNKIN